MVYLKVTGHLKSTEMLMIRSIIEQEKKRQNSQINLIASENYASSDVLFATGSVLTNKYAEGYPGHRYYSGCEAVDAAEKLAIERCKTIFGCEHANVQPHSGSQANMAVYMAFLVPGDTIMGMSLAAGGHLTHGYPINFSGRLFNSVSYSVDPKTEQIDYDAIAKLAHKHKPKMIIAGASAYSQIIDFEKFSNIAQSVGAYLLVDMAHIAGLVAAGLHPNPVPYADAVTSTTHKTLRGPRGGLILCKKKYAEQIDKSVMPGTQGGPLMHVIAAKAVAFGEALQDEFTTYQKQVCANAKTLVHAFEKRGYRVVSGGTENHQFTIDLQNKKLSGRKVEQRLDAIGITVNRNCIPFDTKKPWVTSGIRIGTPAVTTRGMKKVEMEQIVQLIDDAIMETAPQDQIACEVLSLCKQFPIYTDEPITPISQSSRISSDHTI